MSIEAETEKLLRGAHHHDIGAVALGQEASREHLIAGYGPETFAVEFPRHQSIELARAYPDFYHESAHNIFLDAFVSKGLVGLLMSNAASPKGLPDT